MVTFYKYWNINPKREWIRESVAELLGTFCLVFLGNSAVAEKVFTQGRVGTVGTVYVGYALGALVGVLVSAGVSGAHLNPAVTVAGALVRKVDWVKVPHYIVSQYLGAFLAACCTYLIYIDAFNSYHELNGVNITTAGIFSTYPREGLSVVGGFIDQILGTMVLVTAVYGIMDKKNTNVPLQLVPIYVALVVLAIGCSFAYNEGYAINPARDFAPRLFTYFTCWGSQVFGNDTYWYIPILGPHIGGALGAFIYVICIEKMRDAAHGDDTNAEFDIEIVEKKVFKENSFQSNNNLEKTSSPVSSQDTYTYRL